MPAHIRTALLAIALALPASYATADVITDWDEKAVAFVAPRMPPPQQQRIMAIVHAAMFDAVNSIERRYQPYGVQLATAPTTSKEAAAAAAAGAVLIGLYPNEAELKTMQAAYLAAISDSEAKSEGIKLGEAVAAQTLALRARDSAEARDAYRPKTRPGVYIPTPITVASTWPNVKPFGLQSASQFRAPPPVSLESAQWANDYAEIKDYGARDSVKRSAQQTENARFWLMTGPRSYHPIARQLVAAKKMSVVDSARFMTLVAIAEADAYIAVLDAKYHYDFWRPITAIRNGDLTGNPATARDATWEPLDNTPMHPEYPCAHCICSATLAALVETVFGTADVPEVSMTSTTAPGVTHRWTNVWALSKEVSEARIFAGFHYRFSADAGQDMGRKVGQYVAQNVLKPAKVADAR